MKFFRTFWELFTAWVDVLKKLKEKFGFLHMKPYNKDIYNHIQCSTEILRQVKPAHPWAPQSSHWAKVTSVSLFLSRFLITIVIIQLTRRVWWDLPEFKTHKFMTLLRQRISNFFFLKICNFKLKNSEFEIMEISLLSPLQLVFFSFF